MQFLLDYGFLKLRVFFLLQSNSVLRLKVTRTLNQITSLSIGIKFELYYIAVVVFTLSSVEISSWLLLYCKPQSQYMYTLSAHSICNRLYLW